MKLFRKVYRVLLLSIQPQIHTILYDPVWTLFPGSQGGAEVLLSIGFILLTLILLRINRKTAWPVTIAYIFIVLYFTLLVRSAGAERITMTTPFQTIRNAIGWSDGWFTVVDRSNLYALIANVLLFIPFGYLLPTLVKFARRWFIILPMGLLGSLVIELAQLITKRGCFDVDDLIANTLGALAGYLIYKLFLSRG